MFSLTQLQINRVTCDSVTVSYMANFVQPFNISDGPVRMILSNHTMQIPELQRPFAWEENNARELITDLQKIASARHHNIVLTQHYLGSLVVIERAGKRDDVVDGQQRLTTIAVLVGQFIGAFAKVSESADVKAQAAKNAADKQHFQNVANNCRNSLQALRQLVKIQAGVDPQTQNPIYAPRLLVSPEIRQTYDYLIDGQDGEAATQTETKLPAFNIRKIAKILLDDYIKAPEISGSAFALLAEADQWRVLNDRSQHVLDGLVWVRLATTKADAAFELFESLNSKGKPLNVLGLLKVWLLSVLAEQQAPSVIVAEVARDFRSLADDDDKIQVSYFEDFFRMRALEEPEDGETAAKQLSIASRRLIFKDPVLNGGSAPGQPIDQLIAAEISLMKKLAPTWDTLKFGLPNFQDRSLHRLPAVCAPVPNPDWVKSRLHMLLDDAWLKHQIIYPFLTVASDMLASQGKFQEFEDLVHDLEKFFFRVKSVGNVAPKEISSIYFKHLTFLKLHKTLNLNTLKQDLKALTLSVTPDAVFSSKLIDRCVYGTHAEKNRTKYLFSMIEMYSHCPPNQLSPDKQLKFLDLSNWQLEHIVPQNPQSGGHALPDPEVDQLGNLCILPPDWNQLLSNDNYQQKRVKVAAEIAKGHNLLVVDSEKVFTDPALASSHWSLAEHAVRVKWIQSIACKVFVI